MGVPLKQRFYRKLKTVILFPFTLFAVVNYEGRLNGNTLFTLFAVVNYEGRLNGNTLFRK